jgi:hypothetical protein
MAPSQGSFAFPITAITGPPESPVLAFWGGITRDDGDSGDLFLISIISVISGKVCVFVRG